MKKLNIFKTIQLIFLIIITAFCTLLILSDPEVFQNVPSNAAMSIIVGLLWAILAVSFLFLFLDFCFFSSFKKDLKELGDEAYSDRLVRIPNRNSCDKFLEEYSDSLVLTGNIGCMMIDLANLATINHTFGRGQGDRLLADFSLFLMQSGDSSCFVGRNGGNKFLAIFADGSEEKMSSFLSTLAKYVENHNQAADSIPLEYRYGFASQKLDHREDLLELISLANERIGSDVPSTN